MAEAAALQDNIVLEYREACKIVFWLSEETHVAKAFFVEWIFWVHAAEENDRVENGHLC